LTLIFRSIDFHSSYFYFFFAGTLLFAWLIAFLEPRKEKEKTKPWDADLLVATATKRTSLTSRVDT